MTAPMALAVLAACGGGGSEEVVGVEAAETRAHALAVVSGNGVYVDSSSGRDSNSGTQSKPIKTLAKLAAFQLKAGQNVYLNCSGVWRETLTLAPAIIADGATVTGYGNACSNSKPRILGANDYSSRWVKSGNVWSKSVGTSVPKISRLFVNGQMMHVAQWPNATVNNGTSLTDATAPSSATSTILTAADAAALTGRNLVGAKLLVKTQPWTIDTVTVSTYTAATRALTVAGPVAYPLGPNDNYTLQDQQWMVDAPGEFYHDTAKGIVYLYPPDAATQSNLNTAKVEGSIRDNAITLSGRSNVKLTNLSAEMARDNGVYLFNAPGAVLTGLNVVDNTNRGIHVDLNVAVPTTTPSVTVTASKVSGSTLVGIDALHAAKAVISNNVVSGIGTVAHAGNSLAAIQSGNQASVDGNTISDTAYVGVRFSGTAGSVISNNRISTFCVRLEDCAAIYTWNGPKATRNTVDQSSFIRGNVIDGAMVGSTAPSTSAGWLIAGIYLDDFTQGATVESNVVSKTPVGVIVHNGSSNTVTNNKLWQVTTAGLWANMDQTDADYMTANVISGNEIAPMGINGIQWPAAPKVNTAQGIWYWNYFAGDNALAARTNNFTGNKVALLTEQAGREVRARTASGDRFLDATAWRNLNPGDLSLSKASITIPVTMNLGPELVPEGGFDAGFGKWARWISPVATGGYANFVATGSGCDGSCVEFMSSSAGDVLTTPGLNFAAGHTYQLSLKATFPTGGVIGVPYIARKLAPYDSFVAAGSYNLFSKTEATAGESINFAATFTATLPDTAVVNLKLGTVAQPALIDNISVREVLGYTNKASNDIALTISAPANATRTVTCTDLAMASGCTVKGFDDSFVTLPVVLPAGESRLFIKP